MKRFVIVLMAVVSLALSAKVQAQGLIDLTKDTFTRLVWDCDNSRTWKYLGAQPCVIIFYDNSVVSQTVETMLEKLSKEYSHKALFYKVDIARQRELSVFFSADSKDAPTVVFIPEIGPKLLITRGALDEATAKKNIVEVLK
ncbi:MAG: thiol reductase thioredoxin [Mucinivorans sp.]